MHITAIRFSNPEAYRIFLEIKVNIRGAIAILVVVVMVNRFQRYMIKADYLLIGMADGVRVRYSIIVTKQLRTYTVFCLARISRKDDEKQNKCLFHFNL